MDDLFSPELLGWLDRLPSLRIGILGDFCAAPLVLGIAIGRLGCYFAGCCFGKVCPEPTPLTAVQFPAASFAWLHHVHEGLVPASVEASLPVYPVQLYESAGCLVLALLLWRWPTRFVPGKAVPGEGFLAMGVGYALLRFVVEFWRGDNVPISGLTFSQWVGVLIVVLAAITFYARRQLSGKWKEPLWDGEGQRKTCNM